MKLDVVKEFIKLAKDENVASLEYEKDDVKISVKLPVAGSATVVTQAPAAPSAPASSAAPAGPAPLADGVIEVTSPFVGTYYESPSPGEAAFVKVGDRVSVGQTLCILEAMKIMNEIDAEVAGEVVEILVANESLVEFGQPLFRIKK